MVRGHDDKRLVIEAGRAQPLDQTVHQRVRVAELQQVPLLCLVGEEGVVERLVAVEPGEGDLAPGTPVRFIAL